MKRLLFAMGVLLAGCSALPEVGPQTQKFSGELVFPKTTALAPGSVAHIKVLPVGSDAAAKPVISIETPAKSGDAIPFSKRVPAQPMQGAGEFLVTAQIIDHGRVTWSNLTNPTRISFVAEPTDLRIPLRAE